MMKKRIGFIDLWIDEWHANNYPAWIRASSLYSGFELGLAWEERSNPNGLDLRQWCEKFNMTPAASVKEVIDGSDAYIVFAPSSPEVHERLAELPLKSGKPVYVDKPFAPDMDTAKRMFALSDKYGSPLMSSSALRFGNELTAAQKSFKGESISYVQTTGCGSNFKEYAIHQLEMIVSTLGTGATRVMQCSDASSPSLHAVIDYADGRHAALTYNQNLPFTAILSSEKKTVTVTEHTRMFENMLDGILEFFNTKVSPIKREETIEIAALLDASIRALEKPNEWLYL